MCSTGRNMQDKISEFKGLGLKQSTEVGLHTCDCIMFGCK